MDAIVLAGGPADAVAAHTPGAPNKAFVAIAGVTLVERTLRALRAAPSIGQIIVVAPPASFNNPALALADGFRPDGVRISDSLRSGLEGLDINTTYLISASDLPVLNPIAIEDYVTRAAASNADLTYGCIEKQTHMAKYPDAPHTWVRLREGTYCGTGFTTMKPRVWPALEAVIERVGQARKYPWRLASLFGWNVLVRFALGQLSIAAVEARASQVLGAKARAVISRHAEIGINVDRESDIALAERLVSSSA